MKLVGSYLSHFVRRVAIPLNLYGMDYTLLEVSVVKDQTLIREHSKLARIPSLVLDDGDVLIDSDQILMELDQLAPEADRLIPKEPRNRRQYGQVLACLTGAMDKATAWFYEAHRRPKDLVWDEWAEHLKSQLLGGVLQVEENPHIFAEGADYLFENRMTHADIAVGLIFPIAHMVDPEVVNEKTCPKLSALSTRFNELDAFKRTSAQ
ncbi:glutathione S-transferase family protein [Pseudomaricurvus alkylphenolicus]|uniref:glutathione S-transferase family protein n=1 Tax=Pseudomaricurvus alkylphenolicus TaxID=1306991 RepID=UPI0014204BB6|nr:glutathione S-transferase family protein [Pseudomaricurvus alkylphenolicus]NIB43529.1 glutathione S-transferase family protein [Pseudomaricurvus alkylphenolicus]